MVKNSISIKKFLSESDNELKVSRVKFYATKKNEYDNKLFSFAVSDLLNAQKVLQRFYENSNKINKAYLEYVSLETGELVTNDFNFVPNLLEGQMSESEKIIYRLDKIIELLTLKQ